MLLVMMEKLDKSHSPTDNIGVILRSYTQENSSLKSRDSDPSMANPGRNSCEKNCKGQIL